MEKLKEFEVFKWLRDFTQNTDVAADYTGEYQCVILTAERKEASPCSTLLALGKLNDEYRTKGMSEREMSKMRAHAFKSDR